MATAHDPERLARAFELFHEVCDLPAGERRRRLARVAGNDAALAQHVEALLAADELESDLDRPAAALDPARAARREGAAVDGAPPDRIGEFTILRTLGCGGMGIVYEARQDAPRRTVALKVIRPGLLSLARLRRFQHEAEVLGWLDHPGIARVFGAGTAETPTGPQPYIAMELVRGEPIDRHVARRELDTRACLGLLAELCDAVQHAHERGIVHRDLKPANVLVTDEGRLKVLDFGVARITDADVARVTGATEVGELLGTLPYMSPEQIAADPTLVDARSDVYALGVLAYELLSGRTPLDVRRKSLAEAARIIVEEEPTSLGAFDSRLRGDVELIVGKALAKEKSARYATAAELGGDLRRHLADEPIHARAPRRIDQWRRFARRNRGLVGALAVAFVALGTAVVVTSVSLARTTRLLRERNAEIAIADEAIGFLEGMFARTDPTLDADPRLSEAVKHAADRFDEELRDKPVLRARLTNSIGKVLLDLALGERALPLLEEALVARRVAFGPRSVEYAQTLERVAFARQLTGDIPRATELQREVLALRRALLPESELLLDALTNLAGTLALQNQLEESDRLFDEGQALSERVFGSDAPRTIWVRIARVGACIASGRQREAEVAARELLDTTRRSLTLAQQTRLNEHLAWTLRLQERHADALPYVDAALELAGERHGNDGLAQRELLGLKAVILTSLGRTHEAVELMREVRARVVRAEGAASILAARATADLAYAVHDLPDPERREAEALYREADTIFAALLGPTNAMSAMTKHNCALLLETLGRLDEAEALSRESYEVRRELGGESDTNTLASLRGLAGIRERQAALEDSAQLYGDYVRLAAPLFGDSALLVQRARVAHGRVLGKLGRFDEATAVLDEATRHLPATHDLERFEPMLRRQRAELAASVAAAARGEK
jgi:serine/threonine protein kinase/tetratricopeptide (TPR) repeat protein